MRRACRAILAWSLTSSGIALLVVWLFARVVTDRLGWSQYIYWVPGSLLAGTALVAGVLGVLAVPDRPRRRARRLRTAAWAAGIGAMLALGWLVLVDWRFAAAPFRASAPEGEGLSVLHWTLNPTTDRAWARHFEAIEASGVEADVVVLTTFARRHWLEEVGEHLGPDSEIALGIGLSVVSRVPILSWGTTRIDLEDGSALDLRDRSGERRRRGEENGPAMERWYNRVGHWFGADPRDFTKDQSAYAMHVVLDTRESLGRTTTIWLLELPSNPRRQRWAIAEGVAGHMERLRGEVEAEADPAASARTGWPWPPDLLIGDLNIPRGSASIRRLLRETDLVHAHTRAGLGPMPTWPRRLPVYHIDHTFVSDRWAVRRYRILDPGLSEHRMQVVEVVPAEP